MRGPPETLANLGLVGLPWLALLPHTFPGIQSNNEVQIEGIAYIFCGLWISSVLACLCVTSQLNSTAPGSIPGVG